MTADRSARAVMARKSNGALALSSAHAPLPIGTRSTYPIPPRLPRRGAQVPKKIARSPRATLLTIAALSALAGFGATPLVASAHPRHLARAVSASAADREARLQEREARLQEREARLQEREARARERAQMRAARREERAAARAERLAERSQRQAARAQERAARHAGTTDTGEASAPATPPAPA